RQPLQQFSPEQTSARPESTVNAFPAGLSLCDGQKKEERAVFPKSIFQNKLSLATILSINSWRSFQPSSGEIYEH
ncbi:MAG TPA: hypothetical protein PLY72_04785, partial [Candidatus Obscuribacter sp.]|nr:hypothetical protein [Candidatus Obscuribacter sp.]